MFNNLITIINGFIGVLGTGYAVLSILKLKIQDISNSNTVVGINNRDLEMLTQRQQARIGLTLVTLSWLFNSIGLIIQIDCIKTFSHLLAIEIVLIITIVFILVTLNKRFREKYDSYKK